MTSILNVVSEEVQVIIANLEIHRKFGQAHALAAYMHLPSTYYAIIIVYFASCLCVGTPKVGRL
jgi:hypothetical protein